MAVEEMDLDVTGEDEAEEFTPEKDTGEIQSQTDNENDYAQAVDEDEYSPLVCWSALDVVSVCLVRASDTRIVIDVRLAGQRVGRFTLTKARASIRINKELKGPFGTRIASIRIRITANFNEKHLWFRGRVCAAIVCAQVNQRILSWR